MSIRPRGAPAAFPLHPRPRSGRQFGGRTWASVACRAGSAQHGPPGLAKGHHLDPVPLAQAGEPEPVPVRALGHHWVGSATGAGAGGREQDVRSFLAVTGDRRARDVIHGRSPSMVPQAPRPLPGGPTGGPGGGFATTGPDQEAREGQYPYPSWVRKVCWAGSLARKRPDQYWPDGEATTWPNRRASLARPEARSSCQPSRMASRAIRAA